MGAIMIFVFVLGKIILYMLLILLLVLLLVLLAVLIIPFKYYLSGEKLESTLIQGSVSWLFGGIKMRFNYSSENGAKMLMNLLGFEKKLNNDNKKDKAIANEENDVKTKNKNTKKQKNTYSYVTYEVIKKGYNSIIELLNHCKPKQFHLQAKVGFDDPMYTGLLYGIRQTGSAILNKYNIHLEPTFDDEELQGSFIIGGRIQIFYLLLVVIGFLVTKPFRSILLKNIKIKIKRRLKQWGITSTLTRT